MNKYRTAQPTTATRLETALSESQNDRIGGEAVADIWNPEKIPAHLLPYLAWARSVDYWNESWSERQKRDVIKAAYAAHRHKGTRSAIRSALAPFGLKVRFNEWFETGAAPGTFSLDLFNETRSLGAEDISEVERLVRQTKPVSRHLGGLRIGVVTGGAFSVSAATVVGDVITIFPFLVPEIELHPAAIAAAATHEAEILTVNPKKAV